MSKENFTVAKGNDSSLGNCWFLSSLAVIAERPDILEQIVLTKVYNPFGVYQIRLCVDGRWQVVVVDDFFPCNARTRGLAFAVGRRNQVCLAFNFKTIGLFRIPGPSTNEELLQVCLRKALKMLSEGAV
ncbi:unnamed protein product [Toxocara canis]|uniref:Calpain catalytic domain-containing protein n=1 Tax=Toxocara canis TaxID=6265 RepID=A0A183U5Z0_TOXCA|nr:unnamed protein product [Toxocara canis]